MSVCLFVGLFCSNIESETKYGAERDGCYYIRIYCLSTIGQNFMQKPPDIRAARCCPLGGLGSGGLFSVYLERFLSPILK